ncbi:MAG: hypothetical protein VKL39_00520 [Leptolyngbyaceae bacterium]|nr:hypothetical protein [Leptolyngbyaceae bacterium]
MFFPWCQPMGCSHQTPQDYREQRLRFLRWVKDSLETRLAAVNAAIETIESQQQRDTETSV